MSDRPEAVAAMSARPTPTASPPSPPHTSNSPPESAQVLTVQQVAEALQVSRWFVYDHGPELGLRKVGGANRYLRETVEGYLAERTTCAPPPSPITAPRREPGRKPARRVRLLEPATGLRPGSEGDAD